MQRTLVWLNLYSREAAQKQAKNAFFCVLATPMPFKSINPNPNVSTTPIMAMGCQECLPVSVVQLKGKHCRKPYCHNGVVDTFGQYLNCQNCLLMLFRNKNMKQSSRLF